MTRHTLRTHHARVRLLRFAADVLHEEVVDARSTTELQASADACAARLAGVGVQVSPQDLIDYHDARRTIADVDDHVYPGTSREAAIARLDAEEQAAWHEENVAGA